MSVPLNLLNDMTIPELEDLIESAKQRLNSWGEAHCAALTAEWRAKAAAIGFDVTVTFSRKGEAKPVGTTATGRRLRSDRGKPVAAKYRHPNGMAWSGRGRKPRWMSEAEAEGKTLADFAV